MQIDRDAIQSTVIFTSKSLSAESLSIIHVEPSILKKRKYVC